MPKDYQPINGDERCYIDEVGRLWCEVYRDGKWSHPRRANPVFFPREERIGPMDDILRRLGDLEGEVRELKRKKGDGDRN